jgi:hypothetical protein
MSWESGTATSYTDLLDKLNTFLTKGHALPPSYTGTGNGLITGLIGTASSVQETITVTLTGATTFTVSGSVTGSMGSGTVDTPFSHANVAFTLTAGDTAWVSGDTITFVLTAPWVALRAVAGTEYIWQAPGNAGTDQILVGASIFSNVGADYYNWRLGGFTGYASGNVFTNQPGGMTGPILPLWNSNIPYWFVADGKRVIVVAKVSTVFESCYLGFIDPYPSPGQWAYPMAVGGMMAFAYEPAATSVSWRWSYAGNGHHAFFVGFPGDAVDAASSLRIRKPDGTWRGFGNSFAASAAYPGALWPAASGMTDLRPNLDGTYPMFPVLCTEHDGTTANVFGELAGVMATTGHLNAAENTIAVGRETWLVIQNAHRTTKTDYAALRLA